MNNEELEEKKNGFLKKISDWKNYGKIWSSSREARGRRAGCGDSEADAGKAETQSGFAKKAVR